MRSAWAWMLVLVVAMEARADEIAVEPLTGDESVTSSAEAVAAPDGAAEPALSQPANDAGPAAPAGSVVSKNSTSNWAQQGMFFRPWDHAAATAEDPNSTAGCWSHTQGMISQCQPGAPPMPPFVGSDFFNTCVRTAGFVGGVELVLLKPFQGFKAPTTTLPEPAGTTPQTAAFNYDAGQRYWLGYVMDDGLGMRVRYFDFDRGANPATAFGTGGTSQTINGNVRTRQLDLELTQQVGFRRWSLMTFGGMRYGELLQGSGLRENDATANTFIGTNNSFHGLGVTGGLQGQRGFGWCPNFSFYFFGRGSLLFGNQHQASTSVDINTGTTTPFQVYGHNDNMLIWEFGLGPQWQVATSRGGWLFARGGLEAQLYQPSGSGTIDSGNMGLAGFTFSLGMVR